MQKKSHPMNEREYAIHLHKQGERNNIAISKRIIEDLGVKLTVNTLRAKVSKWIQESVTRENHPNLAEYCDEVGLPIKGVRHYWHKGEHHSVFIKEDKDEVDLEQVLEDHFREAEKYVVKYPEIKRKKITDGHLLVIDPADIHIGKLATKYGTGSEYNSEIAIKRVKEGVNGILDKAQGFNIDKILFVAGNDVLHIDNTRSTTTKGTIQNTDGMWYDNFLLAKNLYIELMEQLIQIADVHFVFNPSNHDYMSGFFLAQTIQTWFKDCKNITFDVDMKHRKYFKYHKNLIGTAHGDKGKEKDLGAIMSIEARDYWNSVDFQYFYTHHVHHKTAKDYPNVTVETLRSPSTPDMWHHGEMYIAPEAIEGFIHSKDYGQIARLTHYFKL